MIIIKQSILTGLSFGLTSSIITTLGLMVGLYATTSSRLVVMGGILTIALADSMSDALGIHVSEESRDNATTRGVWESTISTFLVKLTFSLTFLVPVLLTDIYKAIFIAIIWGYLLLGILSYFNSKQKGLKPWNMVFEHLLIMTFVVFASRYIGMFVNGVFN